MKLKTKPRLEENIHNTDLGKRTVYAQSVRKNPYHSIFSQRANKSIKIDKTLEQTIHPGNYTNDQ